MIEYKFLNKYNFWPVKCKNLTLLEARNMALDVLNKHEKDRLKYNLDEYWSENRELNSSENNRQ